MKMQVFERFAGTPVIQIIPQGAEFVAFQATVEVRFFSWDNDGRKIYKPIVVPNVHFGDMTPKSAEEWGEIFKAAALIANIDAGVLFLAIGCDDEINKVWRMIEDSKEKLERFTQHAPAPERGA